jgi:histidinol-phosphate/aromatic aminotransferase/cobyric acid decarboxylase-like protein
LKAYPLREAVFALERHTRERSHYAINLQSCELLHPRVIDIFTSLSTINPANIQLYPYPDETREYIAQQWKMSARTLTLSAGSDSIISIIVEALGSITGKVILQVPNYFGWHNYATLRGLSVIAVSFGKPKRHTFCLNVFLENLRASSPSLVVISNPNNPTGFVFSPQEVLILADECEAYGHLLIIDECFASFANINHYKIIGSRENVIFVRSFSKCFGLRKE